MSDASSGRFADAPLSALAAYLEAARRWTEAELERALAAAGAAREDGVPERLSRALRYAVTGGGKRLRPALVRLVCERCGGDPAAAAAPAVAVELVHTYSLVHDDLPCMDDDDLRRGRPTCHVVHGEALAVLAGDALQALAFEVLSGAGPRAAEMARVLAAAAGAAGMVGGQALDVETEGGEVARALVAAIHGKKTAALFAAAAELGALAAGTDAPRRARARSFGQALGLAFQARDDVLDVTGDARTLGKTPGKDAALARATLVAVLGLEGAEAEARRLSAEAEAAARALDPPDGGLLLALAHRATARDR